MKQMKRLLKPKTFLLVIIALFAVVWFVFIASVVENSKHTDNESYLGPCLPSNQSCNSRIYGIQIQFTGYAAQHLKHLDKHSLIPNNNLFRSAINQYRKSFGLSTHS